MEHFHGPDLLAALQDYDNALRNKIKHSGDDGNWYMARELLFEEMEEHNLRIWE
jgi:hypothetical protein